VNFYKLGLILKLVLLSFQICNKNADHLPVSGMAAQLRNVCARVLTHRTSDLVSTLTFILRLCRVILYDLYDDINIDVGELNISHFTGVI
jgi:hypothetical protein